MWCQVVLLGIMVQVLNAVSEIKARHPSGGTFTNQVQVREILGQLAADSAKDPIQTCVAADPSTLVGEIPHMLAPGLQFDKTQISAITNVNFYNPGMQGLSGSFVMRG